MKPSEKEKAEARLTLSRRGEYVWVEMSVTAAQILIGILYNVGGPHGGFEEATPRDYTDDLLDALWAAVPQGFTRRDQPWRRYVEIEDSILVQPVGFRARERGRRGRAGRRNW